jgi:hypothetical protein
MTLTDKLNKFRDRINPDRAERAARASGKTEPEIAQARKRPPGASADCGPVTRAAVASAADPLSARPGLARTGCPSRSRSDRVIP